MSNPGNELSAQSKLILFAGAGVSAGKPTALPGWKLLNELIAQALQQRLESIIDKAGRFDSIMRQLEEDRDADRFPPEYQAQIIEEVCGERYFRALQALDVDVPNSSHESIAALAATGTVGAIVTTNFDRLIEQSLDARGVAYRVAYDDQSFFEMIEDDARTDGLLPIIKIHGCVSSHLSMIDTLKQRRRGRSEHLIRLLHGLREGHWIYLGFSAADLEGDSGYLGLVDGASRSSGATYVAYPGSGELGAGAQLLMNAYGDHGEVIEEFIDAHLGWRCEDYGSPFISSLRDDDRLGTEVFAERLQNWVDSLTPSATGLSLSAILEASGQAESAVRILDQLVRHERIVRADGADYRALQLHYGRLGAAWGRFVAVPDMNGAPSNASVESTQSLLRIADSELGFAAKTWTAPAMLWTGQGSYATSVVY